VKENIDIMVDEDKKFPHQPISNILYLLEVALGGVDLSAYTEIINHHIQYNLAKNGSNEVKVIIV